MIQTSTEIDSGRHALHRLRYPTKTRMQKEL